MGNIIWNILGWEQQPEPINPPYVGLTNTYLMNSQHGYCYLGTHSQQQLIFLDPPINCQGSLALQFVWQVTTLPKWKFTSLITDSCGLYASLVTTSPDVYDITLDTTAYDDFQMHNATTGDILTLDDVSKLISAGSTLDVQISATKNGTQIWWMPKDEDSPDPNKRRIEVRKLSGEDAYVFTLESPPSSKSQACQQDQVS